MRVNIPRVASPEGQRKFNDSVKDIVDILIGKAPNSKYDRAMTIRDLEKFGIDLDAFLACSKKNPYPL